MLPTSPGRRVRGRCERGVRGGEDAREPPAWPPPSSKLSGAPAVHTHTFPHLTLTSRAGLGPLYPWSQLRNRGPERLREPVELGFAHGDLLSAASLFTSQPRGHTRWARIPPIEEGPDAQVTPHSPRPARGRVWAGEEAGGRCGWVPTRGHSQGMRHGVGFWSLLGLGKRTTVSKAPC